MKKIWIAAAVAVLLLTGCGARETFETVSEDYGQEVSVQPMQILISLPEGTAASAMETEDSAKIFVCDGYSVTTQTLEGGDMDRTLRQITGYGRDQLKCVESASGGLKRCDCVWVCAGEKGDQVCRSSVYSDGAYHYAVTVMADETCSGKIGEIFENLAIRINPA